MYKINIANPLKNSKLVTEDIIKNPLKKFNILQKEQLEFAVNTKVVPYYIPFCPRPKVVIDDNFMKKLEPQPGDNKLKQEFRSNLLRIFADNYMMSFMKHSPHIFPGMVVRTGIVASAIYTKLQPCLFDEFTIALVIGTFLYGLSGTFIICANYEGKNKQCLEIPFSQYDKLD